MNIQIYSLEYPIHKQIMNIFIVFDIQQMFYQMTKLAYKYFKTLHREPEGRFWSEEGATIR